MIFLVIFRKMKIQKMKINNLNQGDRIILNLIIVKVKKNIVLFKKLKDFVKYVNVLNLKDLIIVILARGLAPNWISGWDRVAATRSTM